MGQHKTYKCNNCGYSVLTSAGPGTGNMGVINLADLPFNIGRKPTGANRWFGKIDEVGIWNRPLSANEVQILYEGK